MRWEKRAWGWVRRNWKWIASGLGIILAVAFGVAYKRNSGKSKILEHKLNVKRAEREIGRLEGRREIIREREGDVEGEIESIDAAIEKLKDTATRSRAEVDRLSSKEKLEEFKRLGY